MTDQINPVPQEEPEVPNQDEEEDEFDLDFDDDFWDDTEYEGNAMPDAGASYITVVPAQGLPSYVELRDGEDTISCSEAFRRSELRSTGQIVYYVNNAEVDPSTQVGPGSVVQAAGATKGG